MMSASPKFSSVPAIIPAPLTRRSTGPTSADRILDAAQSLFVRYGVKTNLYR